MVISKIFRYIAACLVLAAVIFTARMIYRGTATIRELLTENKHLKAAITNLTLEEQIGYAKVTSQENKEGRLFTTIKFVETARDDKTKRILEKTYTIEGDIVHFDALIVRFSNKIVMDGEEKSLYLWRRVYGEKTAPENGFAIEEPDTEPQRYSGLLKKLANKDRKLFWTNIWSLSNDPEGLKEYGITAIYGNAVYSQLKRGLVYVFKITPSGQLSPEVIPEM